MLFPGQDTVPKEQCRQRLHSLGDFRDIYVMEKEAYMRDGGE